MRLGPAAPSFDFLKLLGEHKQGAYESAAGFAGLETNVVANGHAQVRNTLASERRLLCDAGAEDRRRKASGRLRSPERRLDAAVVSWSFAERSFGSPLNGVGKTVAINRTPYTVVGVLRPLHRTVSFITNGHIRADLQSRSPVALVQPDQAG